MWRVLDQQIDWFALARGRIRSLTARRCGPLSKRGLSRPLARPGGSRCAGTPRECRPPSSGALPAANTLTSSHAGTCNEAVTAPRPLNHPKMHEITAQTAADVPPPIGPRPTSSRDRSPRACSGGVSNIVLRVDIRGRAAIRDQAMPRAAARRNGMARAARPDLDQSRRPRSPPCHPARGYRPDDLVRGSPRIPVRDDMCARTTRSHGRRT